MSATQREFTLLNGTGDNTLTAIDVDNVILPSALPRPDARALLRATEDELLMESSADECMEMDQDAESSSSSSESDNEVVVEGPVSQRYVHAAAKQPVYHAHVVKGLRWEDEELRGQAEPDLEDYFNEFNLSTKARIELCRKYAAYLSAKSASTRPPVAKKQKK